MKKTHVQPPNHQYSFLEVLAMAITGWQFIELNLLLIYCYLINNRDGRATAAAFQSVVNFNIRLNMTDAAAQVALENHKLLPEWNHLHSKLGKRSKKRNDLVHFMALPKDFSDDPEMILRSSIFDVGNAEPREYDKKQLMEINTSFLNLKEEMDFFLAKLGDWRRPSKKKSHARPSGQHEL
ncbi:MAG TPA: hypothetical protein VHA15_07305 [Burkholderiales bacterium]|nr:hypothetical protein [Burkholderiales bacterium]